MTFKSSPFDFPTKLGKKYFFLFQYFRLDKPQSIYISIHLPTNLYIYLPTNLSIYISIYMYIYYIFISIYLSTCVRLGPKLGLNDEDSCIFIIGLDRLFRDWFSLLAEPSSFRKMRWILVQYKLQRLVLIAAEFFQPLIVVAYLENEQFLKASGNSCLP